MESKTVSVIVPVYKVEKYINECVDSIINQTYKNIEIILVDDGSPDNCGKICDEYTQKDERIKVVHKENGGLSSARNCGIDVANGEYITFVDSDDYILDTMVEKMVNLFENHKADVVQVSFTRGKFVNKNEETTVFCNEECINNYALDNLVRPEAWGKIFKSSLIKDNKFNENIKYAEDLELGLSLYKKIDKIVVSNEELYYYRENPNGITSDSVNEGRLYEAEILHNALMKEIKDTKIYNCLLYRYIRCCFAILNRIVECKKYEHFKDFRNKIISEEKEIAKNEYLGKKYQIGLRILKMISNPNLYRITMKLIHTVVK